MVPSIRLQLSTSLTVALQVFVSGVFMVPVVGRVALQVDMSGVFMVPVGQVTYLIARGMCSMNALV